MLSCSGLEEDIQHGHVPVDAGGTLSGRSGQGIQNKQKEIVFSHSMW